MLNDPMMGTKGPKALGGSPASFYVYVEDCDALFNRAIAAGGKIHGDMGRLQDQFWGDRSGSFKDPFGYSWAIATHKEDVSPEEMQRRQAEWLKKISQQPTHA
jgi:PhnB protein